ncbi:MAG: hypothetical protein H0T79_10880, partial [Deltaproteobacteria bacterium]|nr:hypothetical protein [Deltaproteobacteria bacterium]
FKGHNHNVQDSGHAHLVANLCAGQNLASGPVLYATGNQACPGGALTTSTGVANLSAVPAGGTETRPANAYVNYMIKL